MMVQGKEKMRVLLRFLKKEYLEKAREHYMSNHLDPFKTLVSCVLSQRTRDEVTEKASRKLFSEYSSPEKLASANPRKVQELIYPVGFYKQKSKKIIMLAKELVEEYSSKVPSDRRSLISLPAVGPKTADVTLGYAFGKPVIPVDVHVEVVSKRLGLVHKKAGYEETRKTLEKLTPEKDRWIVNVGLVLFGKETCKTRNPLCQQCKIKRICDYYNKRGEWKE